MSSNPNDYRDEINKRIEELQDEHPELFYLSHLYACAEIVASQYNEDAVTAKVRMLEARILDIMTHETDFVVVAMTLLKIINRPLTIIYNNLVNKN